MKLRATTALFVVALGMSCTKASTEPTDVYHGTWNGAIADRVNGAGTMQLLIPGAGRSGTYSIALQNGATLSGTTGNYNILSGQLNIPFACTPANGVIVVRLEGDRLKGTFTATGCQALTDGTVDLGR